MWVFDCGCMDRLGFVAGWYVFVLVWAVVCGGLGCCLLGCYYLLLFCFNSVVYVAIRPSLALDVCVYIVDDLVI